MALGQAVSEAFSGVPSVLANDVNAALYGEYYYGAGQGCRNLIMIALGTGVGGGVLIDGRLVTGAADGAGEIGHMVLDPQGPRCTCGNRGCLEAYAGSVALLQRARQLAADSGAATPEFERLIQDRDEKLTTVDLSDLALQGDATSSELFASAGRRLGQAVANCVNLLDPDRVIIGGGVAAAGDLILEPCRRYVPTAVLSEGSRNVPVVLAAKGSFAAALGAAALARQGEVHA
jgi:glucokinase